MTNLFLGYDAHKSAFGAGWSRGQRVDLPRDALVQHTFVCGATGYGKTVFAKGIVEQTILSGVPAIVVDFKGDLASLALTGKRASRQALEAVFGEEGAAVHQEFVDGLATSRAAKTEADAYARIVEPRIFTPNSSIGQRVALSAFPSYPDPPTDNIEAEERDQLVESLVRAFGITLFGSEQRARSNENAVKLIEELVRWSNKRGETLEGIQGIRRIAQLVESPPFDSIGGMPIEEYLPPRQNQALRRKLANRTAGAERSRYDGAPLSVDTLIGDPRPGRVPLAIIYLGHLTDFHEQSMVLANVCADIYRWMRRQGGSSGLRLLLYVDEIGGSDNKGAFYPSYPHNPPSKAPLALLVKQGRSAGIGTLLATQNPMSVDVRALGNVDTWGIGRLTRKNDLQRLGDQLQTLGRPISDIYADIANLPKGHFLATSGSLDAPRFIQERWLFSVHRQMAVRQVEAAAALLQDDAWWDAPLIRATTPEAPVSGEESSPARDSSAPSTVSAPAARSPVARLAAPRDPPRDSPSQSEDVTETETETETETLLVGNASPGSSRQWRIRIGDDLRLLAPGETLTIGRSRRSADVVVDDKTVSRAHLQLEPAGRRIHVRPLSPKNTTHLDDMLIEDALVLGVEDAPFELRIGRTVIALEWG